MTLEIETASAGAFADANEADLHRLVSQLNATNSFVIVRRDGDDRFAQAALERGSDRKLTGRYIVEYSLKSGTLKQATVESAERAYELLAGWAFDRRGWKQTATWTAVDLEWVVDIGGNCDKEKRADGFWIRFPLFGVEATGSTEKEAFSNMVQEVAAATRASKTKRKQFADWCANHVVKRRTSST